MKILTADQDYLFDSTVYIDYFRQRPVAMALFQQVREEAINVSYSLVTVAELWSGSNPRWNEANMREFLATQRLRMPDALIAEQAGRFRRVIHNRLRGRAGLPSISDCMIAATAHDHDLYVLTRNQRHFQHFQPFGVKVQFYEIP